jgi:hypothetical protein
MRSFSIQNDQLDLEAILDLMDIVKEDFSLQITLNAREKDK